MSGPLGHTFLYNLIILFILIVFGFLAGTMSYYKAMKVNDTIVSEIEKYEGYNTSSKDDGSFDAIERNLATLGYSYTEPGFKCPTSYGGMSTSVYTKKSKQFEYCIYVDPTGPDEEYHTYGVLTFIKINLPLIKEIKIPVFTKTKQIYNFHHK